MIRLLIGSGLFVLLPVWASAVDAAEESGAPSTAPHYKMTIKDAQGHEREEHFDPHNKEHQEKLVRSLAQGELNVLEKETKANLLDLSWDLGLWTLVVFLLLYLVLKRAAWGPMLEGLQKREENIAAALEESRRAREEAAGLRDHLAQERAKIAEEVRAALDEAREDGRRLVEEMQSRAKSEIQADRDRLRREIETARDQAIHELWTQSANLATMISAKVIGRELNPDDHRRLVDEAINDLESANIGWKGRTLY